MSDRPGFWSLMVGSLGSAAAYRHVASRPAGGMFGYLAVLILLMTLVVTALFQVAASRGIMEVGPSLREKLPEIQIANGEASSPVPQPYVWEGKSAMFVLDTTGQVTDLERRGVLVTKTELIYRKSDVESRRYSLRRFGNTTINAEVVGGWLNQAKAWLWIPVGALLYAGLWIAKLFQILAASLVSLLVNALARRGLTYGQLFNLGIYAATVPTLVDMARYLPPLRTIPGFVPPALYAGYLAWGILAQPTDQERSSGTPAPPVAS
jgi:hypothetical protein